MHCSNAPESKGWTRVAWGSTGVPLVVLTRWADGTLLSTLARAVQSVSSRYCSPALTPAFSHLIVAEHAALAIATRIRAIARRMI